MYKEIGKDVYLCREIDNHRYTNIYVINNGK